MASSVGFADSGHVKSNYAKLLFSASNAVKIILYGSITFSIKIIEGSLLLTS
jgi:hypothetical protein